VSKNWILNLIALNFFARHKKKVLIIAAVSLLSVVLLIVPKPAHAGLFSMAFDAFSELISYLATIVFWLLGQLLKLAGGLFNWALDPARQQFTKAQMVQDGWKITRDIANMFFALILVIIAFATILGIESYGVKAVLPKLIIAALLINFSLVIAGVMIDFTQVLTNYFFKSLSGDISQQLVANLNVGTTFKPPPEWRTITAPNPTYPTKGECTTPPNTEKKEITYSLPSGATAGSGEFMCFAPTPPATKSTEVPGEQFLRITFSTILGAVLLAVAIFALVAGAILLIIRVIYLWFLLILAPLAWLSYAFPALHGQWSKWWHTFFSQAFFAPIYVMMIYIAIKASKVLPKATSITTDAGSFDASFIYNYLIVIGFLIGALIVARTMGAYGASAIISAGKKAQGTAQKWTKRQAMKPINAGVDRAGGVKDRVTTRMNLGLGKLANKLGMAKTEARFKLRAEKDQRKLSERPYMKKQQEILTHASDQYLVNKVREGDMTATYVAYQKGLHRKYEIDEATGNVKKDLSGNDIPLMDATLVKKMNDNFLKMNDRETAGKLIEARVDALEPAKIEGAVANAVQSGNAHLISAMALQNKKVMDALCKYAQPKDIEAIRNRSKQHETALTTTLTKLSTDSRAATSAATISALKVKIGAGTATDAEKQTVEEDDRIQLAYSSQSGDIRNLSVEQASTWAKKAGPDGLKRMQFLDSAGKATPFDLSDHIHREIAKNIPANKLRNIVENMVNDQQAKEILDYIKTDPGASGHVIATKDPYLSNLNP